LGRRDDLARLPFFDGELAGCWGAAPEKFPASTGSIFSSHTRGRASVSMSDSTTIPDAHCITAFDKPEIFIGIDKLADAAYQNV
jgi:hypothetical protein